MKLTSLYLLIGLLGFSTIGMAQNKVGVNTTTPGSTLSVNGNSPVVNGFSASGIPNTISMYFPGISAEKIIAGLPNLALSTGSACSSALKEPSHVLTAMGLSEENAFSSIRLSLGRGTTLSEIEDAVRMFRQFFSQFIS